MRWGLCVLGCACVVGFVVPVGAQVQFANVTAEKGFGNIDSVPGDGHAPGAVFTDLNKDGYPDAYIPGGRNWSAGQMLPNRLYLNVPDGAGGRRFSEIAGAAGAGDTGERNGALAADYDNDGDQDLFVINWNEANALYRNNLVETGGTLGFVNVTASTDPTPNVADDQHGVGLASTGGAPLNQTLSAAWADPDRDGDLDLYTGTHHGWFGWGGSTPGERDTFYMNNGDGTFTDVTESLNVPGFETSTGAHTVPGVLHYSSTNAVIFADFDNDQWPDLLVTNKVGGPPDYDMLYRNQGADAEGNWLGFETVTYNMPNAFGHRSGAAMGVDVGDADNDGDLDIYITDWSPNLPFSDQLDPNAGQNDLWVNQFAETGVLSFVHSDELKSVYSWGTQFEDFDNNGWQDVHVATHGTHADSFFINGPEGFSSDVAAAVGMTETHGSRGDVSADYDRDGLLDLLVINPWTTGESVLYENRSDELPASSANGFVSIKLTGDPTLPGRLRSSRDAIGARVFVEADLDGNGQIGSNERLIREVVSGSSNAASTSSLDLEFGIGLADDVDVEILWPSGRTTRLTGIGANSFLEVEELGGDVNGDGRVNAADYTAWRDQLGESTTAADYDVWRAQFGRTAWQFWTPGGEVAVPVPESASINCAWWLMGILAAFSRTTRRQDRMQERRR